MKKSISILLLLCMLVGLFGGVSAFAVDGEESIGDDIAVSDIVEEAEEVIEPEAEVPAAETEAEPAPAEEPAAEEAPAEEPESEEIPAEETAEEQPEAEEAPASEEMAEEVSEDGTDFSGWTKITGTVEISEGGNYYLDSNVTGNITVNSGVTATLDLNGHVLTGTGYGSVIINNGTLEIKDSNSGNQTHNFKVGEDGVWTLTSDAKSVDYESLTARPAAGTVVAVKGGCITGGSGTHRGGGICNYGILAFTSGNIIGNEAEASSGNSAYGAGIYNNASFNMSGGAVIGNASYGDTESYYDNFGGGIYCDGSSVLTITGGEVSFNKVTALAGTNDSWGYGGGIHINSGTATVSNCTITYNYTDGSSGGIEAGQSGVTLTMTNCTISHNEADWAGATASYGATVTMTNCTISGNKALVGTWCCEGALYNSNGNMTLNGCTISGNKATYEGGIYNSDNGTMIITGCTICDNVATQWDGGGIINVGTMTITNTTISGNKAATQGGGIANYTKGARLTLGDGTVIINNTTQGSNTYPSGGVFSWDGPITVTGKVIIKDNVNKDADGNELCKSNLCLSGKKAAQTIALTDFSADSEIGVVTMLENEVGPYQFTVNGAFSDVELFNSDNANYQVSYNSEGYLELIEAVCFIDFDKDGVYVAGTDNYYATVQKAVNDTEDNTATNIVMIADSQENVTLANTKNITLDLNGYVISGKGNSSVIKNEGTLTIQDSNKDNQSHKFTVGENGLWTLDEDSGTETVTGGCITGGTGFADGDSYRKSGGGIYNTGTLTVTGGNIIGNQAKMNGGGIYNYGTLTVNGGSITGNLAKAADGDTTHASTSGGGIYSFSQSCTISGGTISNNSARNGGGVDASGSMTISGTAVISDNTALYGGGIINYGTLTVTGGSISGNKAISVEDDGRAGGLGGGIYNTNTLNMQGSSVTGNTADYGGGICNSDGGMLTIEAGAITGNTADYGGGISNINSGTLNIQGGSISGNEAEYGGGIYNKDTLTMTDGTISGNKATKNGGGVYLTINTNTAVGGSTNITGNTVSGEANNVYLDDSGDGVHAKMTIAEGDNKPTTMKIGVSIAENAVYSFKNPYQITTNGTADDRQYFSGDNGETIIYLAKEGGALYLQPGLEFTIEGLDDYVVGTKSEDAIVTVGCEAPKNDNADDCISKDNFKCLTIGGESVPESCFEVKDGCIILTLSKDYLNTLAVGKYTLTVTLKDTGETAPNAVYDGVELSADFNVLPIAKKQAPSTGDNNALGLWIGIASVSVVAMGAVLSMKRREN